MPSRRRRLPSEPILSAYRSADVPASLDWREYGFVTPPVDQRSCGSCYAHSIAESIEGQIFKQTGTLLDLSAQQLVDCSAATGNLGCIGGSLRNTLRYLERSKGLMSRFLYPYIAEVHTRNVSLRKSRDPLRGACRSSSTSPHRGASNSSGFFLDSFQLEPARLATVFSLFAST